MDNEFRLGQHGGRRIKGHQGDGITLKRGSTGRAYIVARLRRDGFDELAADVVAGRLSARRAALAVGWGVWPAKHRSRAVSIDALIG